MKSEYKEYLGDGLYADYDGEHIVLTAENGIEATDTVYLNRDVFEELLSYEKRLREGKDEETGRRITMAKICLPPDAKRSGIDITYQQKKNVLIIGGWYDGFVGIEPTLMPLTEFFKQLGITRRDCERAFAEQPASDGGEQPR